jgi:Ni,Fe-hydrogenase III large subunit
MPEGQKTSKIKEIKKTVSDVAEIIHQIRIAGVQESFGNIMDTSRTIKEIVEDLKTPEMVKNIENFRLISENLNEVSTKMQNSIKRLEETGLINEATGLIKSVKSTVDSFGNSNQGSTNGHDLHEMIVSIKEMFKSIRSLVDELRITVAYSKKSGAILSIDETIKEVSSMRSDLKSFS